MLGMGKSIATRFQRTGIGPTILKMRQKDASSYRRAARGLGWYTLATLCILPLMLSGCGSFFAKDTGTTGTTTPVTGSGDYLYIANTNTSLDTVAGYSLASGALTGIASSPYQIAAAPSVLAITPSNSILYVGSVLGGIYGYTIGTAGVLTSNGVTPAQAYPSAMAVDATGKYLLVLQGGTTNPTLSAFPINTTTGALSNAINTVVLDTGTANQLLLVPDSSLVYVSLGASGTNVAGGVDALTFDSSTGTLTKLSIQLSPTLSGYADIGLASDPAGKFLFVSETGTNGVRSLTINSDGTLTEVTGSPAAAGKTIGAIVVDSTGAFLYVANRADNTISAFTISSTGALTPIAGSPFATGSTPLAMVEDNTHAYLAVVCSAGTPDLQVFTITPTTGVLVSTLTQATGSVSPAGASAIVASQ